VRRTKKQLEFRSGSAISRHVAPQHSVWLAGQGFFSAKPGRGPANKRNVKMKSAEQFITFGQGNMEALVKASQIVATGLQDLSKQIAAVAQANMEESMSTFRAMAGVRSVKEAFELQSTFARASVEKAVAQTGQITEASLKLVEQACEPIAGRMTLAAESFKAA
jgi:phasin family protein